MSENVYAEPYITKKVHFDQDHKDSMVDIYVSAESLRVYENPWVEGTSPNVPEFGETQHPERKKCTRSKSIFQNVVYLLLLAVIVALICLVVQMKKDRTKWSRENTNLRETGDQLRTNNTELRKEIDSMWGELCAVSPFESKRKRMKCKNPDRPTRKEPGKM